MAPIEEGLRPTSLGLATSAELEEWHSLCSYVVRSRCQLSCMQGRSSGADASAKCNLEHASNDQPR